MNIDPQESIPLVEHNVAYTDQLSAAMFKDGITNAIGVLSLVLGLGRSFLESQTFSVRLI